MAKSTYLELVNKAVRECGVSGGDLSSVTGQTGMRNKMVNWVADADIHVQQTFHDWKFLFASHSDTTITGNKDYTQPTDLGHWDVHSFYLNYTSDSYIDLEPLSYEEWYHNYGLGTQSNDAPSYVVVKPNKDIILHAPPDDAYTLTANYYKAPVRLSANTSTSNIPQPYEQVIIYRAMMLYAQHEEAHEMMQYATGEFQNALNALKTQYAPHLDAVNQASIDMVVRTE